MTQTTRLPLPEPSEFGYMTSDGQWMPHPVWSAEQQTKPYSIRLTEAEIVKLKAIGMDRLRAWLRRTSPKDQR